MKKILLSLVFPLLFLSFSNAQEICDDGVDNDGDGFIDCYDSDCSSDNACEEFFIGNDASCETEPTAFPNFSLQLGYRSENHVTNNLSRIAIGDLDRDGLPEILSTNKHDNKIYILNGDHATVKYSTTVTSPEWRASMANVQDDDCGEVFIVHRETMSLPLDYRISAYNCRLEPQWTSESLPNEPVFLGHADFDGDGKPELYYKDEIRDPITGTRIVKNAGVSWNDIPGGPIAVDIIGDEDLELIIGNKIYAVDLGNRTHDSGSLTLLTTMPGDYQTKIGGYASAQSAAVSVADYNLDGFLDVVVTGANDGNVSSVFLWDVKNNTVKVFNDAFGTGDYQYGWKRGIGRVNIADLDGDGQLNAAFVSGKYLYALDENWNQLWRVVVNEETSGITGCTLFDFNGDGRSEVVYRDEDYLYIINGQNGSVNTLVPCRSRTNIEYPIVADVDANGSTEICVVCVSEDHLPGTKGANLATTTPAEVRIYRSAGQPWQPTRKVWNQHAYFNVNINDDLSVPKRQQKHHLVWSENICEDGKKSRPLNGFLNQSPFLNSDGCPTIALSDLSIIESSFAVSPPKCPDENFTISFDFENLGDVAVSGTIPITFYEGNPMAAGATKLNTETISLNKFEVGQVGSAIDLVVHGTGAQFTLYAVLNDNGSTMPSPITFPSTNFLECDYDNNIVSAEINPIPFALSTEQTNNLTCAGDNVPASGFASVYRLVGADKETANYDFHWFDGPTVSGTADYIGSTYTGLSAGTYTVFATAKMTACSSDTVQVVIKDSIRVIDAEITVNSGNDNCQNPNGELSVSVEDTNGNPQPAGDFTYEWYVGNTVGGGLAISTSPIAKDLNSGTYTVLVTEKLNGCQTVSSQNVPDSTVVEAHAGTAIETCDTHATLAARATDSNEIGTWSISSSAVGISTPATFDDVNDPATNFNITDSSVSGDYVIRWTVTDNNNNCPEAFDEITITYESIPSAGTFNTASSVSLTTGDSPFNLFSLLDAEDSGGTWSLTYPVADSDSFPALDASTGLLNLSSVQAATYEFTYTVNGTLACATDSETVSVSITAPSLSNKTSILAFSIPEETSPANIDSINHKVEIEVNDQADLTNLKPEIQISEGASIKPDSGGIIDFTDTVYYTVTAEDSVSKQEWLVQVTQQTVEKADQTITFDIPSILNLDQSPFPLAASSSSGLAVEFTVESGNATIEDNSLVFVEKTSITLKAFQAGNDTINSVEIVKNIEIISGFDFSVSVHRPDGNPLKEGLAKVFSTDGKVYEIKKFTNGDLLFTDVKAASYILQIIPIGGSASDLYPTYYSTANFNSDATTIEIDNNLSLDMEMLPKRIRPDNKKGDGIINGRVLVSENQPEGRIMFGEIADGLAVEDLDIYLLEKPSNSILESAVTDASGDFSMTEIPSGSYTMTLEIPGVEKTQSSFDFDYDENDDLLEISIFITKDGGLKVDIETILGNDSPDLNMTIYPNPTSGIIHLSGEKVRGQEISIFNLSGSLVKIVSLPNSHNHKIDISDLENGVYYIQLGDDQQTLIKIIKKS